MSQIALVDPLFQRRSQYTDLLAALAQQDNAAGHANLARIGESIQRGAQEIAARRLQAAEFIARLKAAQRQAAAEQMDALGRALMQSFQAAQERAQKERLFNAQLVQERDLAREEMQNRKDIAAMRDESRVSSEATAYSKKLSALLDDSYERFVRTWQEGTPEEKQAALENYQRTIAAIKTTGEPHAIENAKAHELVLGTLLAEPDTPTPTTQPEPEPLTAYKAGQALINVPARAIDAVGGALGKFSLAAVGRALENAYRGAAGLPERTPPPPTDWRPLTSENTLGDMLRTKALDKVYGRDLPLGSMEIGPDGDIRLFSSPESEYWLKRAREGTPSPVPAESAPREIKDYLLPGALETPSGMRGTEVPPALRAALAKIDWEQMPRNAQRRTPSQLFAAPWETAPRSAELAPLRDDLLLMLLSNARMRP